MQGSERTTRSSRKFVPEKVASPGPESQSDSGQYMCIECSETFNTRLELNAHRQSHVTKKQFMCTHCGRGFHHQVFLQMHERSHEDEGSVVKPSPARVISTRSSKMSDVVHVNPTCMKPQRLLNSIVEFKSEPKVCQTFTPREFVTRRSHGAASPVGQKDGPDQTNLFELRISKFSDTTVHLVDSFGNSIEILANVFNSYTIGEPERKDGNAVESLKKSSEETPLRNASGETSSKNLTEEPSVSSQTKPTEPPRLDSQTDSDLLPSHELATTESIISEKLNIDDPGLPEPGVSNVESAGTPEQEKMETDDSTEAINAASDKVSLQPSDVPQENVNHGQTADSATAGNIAIHAEDHMDTSPEDATSTQELRNEPEAMRGVDQPAERSSTADQPVSHTDSQDEISIAELPVEISNRSKDQSLVDDPGTLKDAAEESKQPEKLAEVKQNPELTVQKPDAETGKVLIPRVDSPKVGQEDSSALSGNVSAHSAPLEKQGKEDANLSNTLSVNRDDVCLPTESESMDKKAANERGTPSEDATLTLPSSEDDSERIGVGKAVPKKHDDVRSVSIKEKNVHLETDICMASQDVGDVSISEGDVCSPERTLQVDNKDSENHCSLLAGADVLPDDQLVIDDKRDDDLFERDIFPLEAPMEACEKGLVSIEEEQNIVCGGETHSTKIVQEKDSDICLNGSDMTYISESEMIKLLEQDKDDITDDEPITTSQKDLENVGPSQKDGEQNTVDGTSKLPVSFEKNVAEVQHYQSKLKTTDHVCLTPEIHAPINMSTLQASSKMDTDSCLPASLLAIDEPRTGDAESQNSIESMLTQESVSKKSSKEQLSFDESSSSSKLVTRESKQNDEPCESSSGNDVGNPVGDSTLSRTKPTHDNVTGEENNDVLVTMEDNECDDNTVQKINHEKPHPSIPDYKVVSATVGIEPAQTKILDGVNDTLPSPQKDVFNPKLDTEAICNQEKFLEKKTIPVDQERESSPSDVLDYMQSTSDDNDDHTNAASSQRADLNKEGMLNKPVNKDTAAFLKEKEKCVDNNDAETDKHTQEQTTDLSSGLDRFSKSLPTTKNDKSKETDPDSSIIKDVEEDLEMQRVPSPKTKNEDIVSEVMGGDEGSAKQVSDVLSSVSKPVCQDNVEDALDDSELMDNDHEENEDSIDTPSKAFGSGGECLKCGRKLRRSRKELVWFPECFKCRKAAKRQERLFSHEIADSIDLTLDPLVSKREKSLSAGFPGSHIKRDGKGLQDTKLHERNAQGSAARKMYKCPKCEKAFRLPALLAGHIKCHTLPQCLDCGCQMQLKYKTKRIPKRCQKCFQQFKEKIRAEKKVREDSGDEDSDSSDGDVAESLADINPDDLDDEEVDSKKSKEPSENQEIESSDELDTSDQNLGLLDGEKPRLCPECGKAFPCNRSFKLHLLSHTGIQCETCGCRLPKKRKVGRASKKCRSCRLHVKDKPLNDTENETGPSSNKLLKQKNMASLRLKAKQTKIVKNTKIQSIIKKKKELKWLNMLLAVKGLMDKSRKKKENALKAADAAKKDGESSEAEKCDTSSAENTSVIADLPDIEKAGSSKLPCPQDKTLSDTPKRGRKCLYKEKNIIKVEESEVPYLSTSAGPISTEFIKKEETWQCLECNQTWPNSEALVNHQHSHVSGQSFPCPQCPQVFSSEQYLDIHTPAHDDDRPFCCPECDKTFTKRNHLGVHMRVHSGIRPYVCPDCPCRFRQKVTLIAHRYSHRNYQLLFTKPFQCSVCSKSFKQKERLVVHERLHTGECPFSCKDCDKVFPSKARLYVHRKMHKICESESSAEQTLGSNEVLDGQPFKCQDCGKVCSTKASFVLHRKVHRLSSIPVQSIKREQNEDVHPFSCIQCNKIFSTKGNLVMHLKNHSAHKAPTKSEKNLDFKECFPCKVCDKVCFTKASLALHRKVHKVAGEENLVIKEESDTPSYICKDCNKVCATKKSLVLHRKMHKIPKGTDTETPPFRCKDCDMVCTTKASFALHRKVHRSSSNQQSPKTDGVLQSYNCKHCDMVCSTKASFALHSKVHKTPSISEQKLKSDAEPRLYNCKHCEMVCSTKASFVLHSKVHKSPSISEQNLKADSEPQSYNCKHCDVVCSSKSSFILHSKMHRPLTGEQSLKAVEEPQLYNCKHCDMVCTTKASFALHSKVHRSLFGSDQSPKTSEESQTFSCKHCDMVCSTKASFVLHSKVHASLIGELSPKAPEEPQSYSCKECDMVCSTKASFALHCKVHRSGQGLHADTEENAFTCSECNKVCSTKASFILHCKVHKSSNAEHNLGAKLDKARPFQCKECGKCFTSKGRLLSHRIRLHENSSSHDQNSDKESDAEQPKKTSDEKPYACTICELRFAKLKVLVRHKAVHGERSVTPCIHCGKRFLYMKSLFNHIKICQSKKGKKLLPKKVVKRKIPKDGGSTSSDGESVQKKRKIDEKLKALTAAQKLKNKNLTVKAKKATLGKEKGKGKSTSDPKTKEKRTKLDSEASSEGEGKKTATEKQSDGKQEKPSEQAAKEPTLKKNLPKVKKVKKEPAKDKRQKVASGGPKKWKVLAASTVKKKNLQAVLIGGKKKLLMKKKVQVKPKSGGKASKD